MYLLGLHGFKQLVDISRLRYIRSLPDQIGNTLYRKLSAVKNRHLAHSVFQMEDTYDMINVFLVHRISGIAVIQHKLQSFLQSCILLQCKNVFSVCHNILSFRLGKFHNILDHLCFVFFYNAFLMGIIYHGNDLFLCHLVFVAMGIYAEESDHPIGEFQDNKG